LSASPSNSRSRGEPLENPIRKLPLRQLKKLKMREMPSGISPVGFLRVKTLKRVLEGRALKVLVFDFPIHILIFLTLVLIFLIIILTFLILRRIYKL
jgi:hypothetical protein